MAFRTWPVAALGLGGLLVLIVLSMLTLSQQGARHLRRTGSTQYPAPQRRRRSCDVSDRTSICRVSLCATICSTSPASVLPSTGTGSPSSGGATSTRWPNSALLDPAHGERIDSLQAQLEEYWQTFEPLFDWTPTEKIFRSAAFLRREVVPRREAVLGIAQEIEELNNANLAAQTRRGRPTARRRSAPTCAACCGRPCCSASPSPLIVVSGCGARAASVEQRALPRKRSGRCASCRSSWSHTQEEERKNLSRELHDHVAQVLTALRMELGRIERTSRATRAHRRAVAECRRLVDDMFRTVRDLALGLRPSMLDDFGLQPALEWHVRDFTRPLRRGRRSQDGRRLRCRCRTSTAPACTAPFRRR